MVLGTEISDEALELLFLTSLERYFSLLFIYRVFPVNRMVLKNLNNLNLNRLIYFFIPFCSIILDLYNDYVTA